MRIHFSKDLGHWYKFILPKDLRLIEPKIKWLFWDIEFTPTEQRDYIHDKTGQSTFVYCPNCNNELVSSNSFVKDTDYVYYKCDRCGTDSKWDFDFMCPILVEFGKEEYIENKK